VEPLAFDPLLVWLAVAATATLFAQAAIAKVADLPLLEQHLAAYGVPHFLRPVGVRALPAVEALAALLLLTPLRGAGAWLAAALLALYGAAMAWHRLRGRRLDCGCGGEPLPVSWALVARNAALAALALAAGAPMTARPMGVGDFLVVAGAVLVGTLLVAALHQLLRHRAGMRAPTDLRRT
jgi:hypothetical protein